MVRGNLDVIDLRKVIGWAQDDAQPDEPISLVITHNHELVGRILANRYRRDLEEAGIGSGRHGFEFEFETSLAPLEKHILRVFSESDGADLAQSPVTIEPTQDFNAEVLTELILRSGSSQDLPTKIDFLAEQIEVLLQQLADHESNRVERHDYKQFLARWRRQSAHMGAVSEPPRTYRRALIIEDRIPRSDRDAGSTALLSHIQSLQRLGYKIVFAPSVEFADIGQSTATLEDIGVTVYRSPYYGSIEEVLRRQAGEFDVVYLHRASNASKYGELARYHNPKARQIFSVADLHHVRYARQARAESRPELMALSHRARFVEYVAAISADAVITHSPREAQALAKHLSSSKIHTVQWSINPRPTQVPFARRSGIAFIGGYGHAPNLDAARWLISDIMPAVQRRNPNIQCMLVGSEMPEHLRNLCKDGVVPIGYVKDLSEIFDRVRLTVAPLTYGAGIKGKVIESLGAGLPCVCTPIAAEGLDLPAELQASIAEDVEALAALICTLHEDQLINESCSRAGLNYVIPAFSEETLDDAMRRVLGPASSLAPTNENMA